MVVIETASEREEEERLTSAQWPEKILTHTPGLFPSLLLSESSTQSLEAA